LFSTAERPQSELLVVSWGEHVQGGVTSLAAVVRVGVRASMQATTAVFSRERQGIDVGVNPGVGGVGHGRTTIA
jgi:hypothetical protein